MTKEIHPDVAKWIEELRSGKHSQTQYKLLSPRGAMCCLGVYAKCVMGLEPEPHTQEDDNPEMNGHIYSELPASLKERGLGRLLINDCFKKNDNGSRFKTIANFIEREVTK